MYVVALCDCDTIRLEQLAAMLLHGPECMKETQCQQDTKDWWLSSRTQTKRNQEQRPSGLPWGEKWTRAQMHPALWGTFLKRIVPTLKVLPKMWSLTIFVYFLKMRKKYSFLKCVQKPSYRITDTGLHLGKSYNMNQLFLDLS